MSEKTLKVFLKSNRKGIDARAKYYPDSRRFVIMAGSVLSQNVSESPSFRGKGNIQKMRDDVSENNVLIKNITFKSPSTAANFVTGRSTNGLIEWKDAKGRTLKQLLEERTD